ncbi:MAG: response regulator [Bacillota bacterium]
MIADSLILIVDDTTQNLQVLGSMLKKEGYKVAAITSGEGALDFVTKRMPDLILLDIMMPGLSGYQVCEKLYTWEEYKRIPVIFISALNKTEDKLEGFEAGGVDFITKPFQKQEVLARVKTHLKLKESREKIADYAKRLEKRNAELERLQAELNQEWIKGKKLHQKFLPEELINNKQLETAVYYQAAQKIGGDFYNFIEFNGKLIAYVVDITGHGLDGALLNIFVREAINSFLDHKDYNKKAIELEGLLEYIYQKYATEKFSDDYFICIGLFLLDKETMELTYANSGLQFSPLLISDTEVTEIDVKELPISTAIALENYDFEQSVVKLNPGDKIISMTDGIIEENNNDGFYGAERIKQVIKENIFLPVRSVIEEVKKDFNEFMEGESYQDDVTLLGLEYKPEIISREKIEITSNFKELDRIRNLIKDIVGDNCVEADKLLMAVHELLANAIEHGNSRQEEEVVTIITEETQYYWKVIIEDQGQGFNWEQVLSTEEIYDDWRDSGRGLRIAALACDNLYYNKKGNKVFLIKSKTLCQYR